MRGIYLWPGRCPIDRPAPCVLAVEPLVAGRPVGVVARHLGHATPSAFVTAFRRETGTTPSAVLRPAGAAPPDLRRR
ncbi:MULTISPECIES: AraC family transcriptional regulator [Pseudonocardia]|jgi:AraC-like DNA-binding protein|uniref:AraC family transcriptional regulator n=1 Tax=Pseudonocardia TaxID=1847 RepID=UPI000917127E|nr:AraC family transcriptional regulator [Pseudonocardia sp. SID8383]MYW72511.1 AraC family transcriptional regulator [Pseudonocardia sp. SID8383]OJG07291.1 hypothetical protein BG618_01237 [Pseudonocardia autotrophica]